MRDRWAVSSWALLGVGMPAAVFVGVADAPGATYGYLAGVLVCVIAAAVGIGHNVPPGHRRPWLLTLAAMVISLAGETTRVLAPGGTVLAMLPDLALLPIYLLLTASVADLVRRTRATADDPARVDAALIGVGAALLVWSLWIEPWIAVGDPRWQNLVAAALPLAPALLVTIALPVLLLGRTRAPAMWFFVTSGMALLAANIVLANRGWFVQGPDGIPLKTMGALVLAADFANAACVLHPTVPVLTERVLARSHELRRGRITLITATLCVPTVLGVVAPPRGQAFSLVRAALALALIGVVVARVIRANNSRARAEQEARWRAEHDSLTGLPNRERLAATVSRWTAPDTQVSVLLLDLDRFKLVNDHWGHEVGDEMLRAAAARVAATVRADDLVCRTGGDEFAVAMTSPTGDPAPQRLADRLLEALEDPLPLSVGPVDVTASIGIATAGAGTGAVELLRDADTAMYRAKESGRNRYAVFDPQLRERLQRRVTLERALRGALHRGQLDVHYQPLVHLATEEVDGFEALMRWTHPELGPVSPVEFIPIAEDSGLIVEAGAWLLEEAATRTREWRETTPVHVSVNLAVRQLREPGLAERVAEILIRTGLPPEALWLEVTESGFMDDPDACLHTLHELRNLGITLCIDDFGTGFSSLSYLQRLPVTIVKIDRAFVTGVGDGGPDESIVRAVLAMSHALGHRVVAEGVETTVQRDWLRANGCDYAQGWLYGKPLPAAQTRLAAGRVVQGA
ncbi:putative bifunctional diguanylate cyclase/phosphodiesterase [Actinoplanes sp. CA-252034]|uniref:putative bifunctional diguanylate cyclase/phosphodiesterase n=1 Tax=Actinoplanes sp. CA-252034 TaxID=3239906 RepID=UPI003D97ACB4